MSIKKSNQQKLAKAQAQRQNYDNGLFSRKHDPKGFNEINERITFLKEEILKEKKIDFGKTLKNKGFSRLDINIYYSDLNLNNSEFDILSEI